jgi:anti-anti-sigma regulatory factor
MDTTIDQVERAVPVTVIGLTGELDASNYLDLIGVARTAYQGGTRHVVVDLINLTYMGSSGLVALYAIGQVMAGREPPDPEEGWGAFHSLASDVESGTKSANVKLVGPQPSVDRVLERTGLRHFYEVHPDRDSAIASFLASAS